ncbi:sporulation protein YabP [Clostridium sp. CAG:465]|jgi:sporulation protein YabP|nr:sporulation protein YabP [Clostridium sp. CAG:465]
MCYIFFYVDKFVIKEILMNIYIIDVKSEIKIRSGIMEDFKMNKTDKVLTNQNIIMENREKVSVTGVIDIHSFDDELVIAQTDLGILTIKGDDLKMNKLNLENNELIIEGKIIAVAYSDINNAKKTGFMNKLFK